MYELDLLAKGRDDDAGIASILFEHTEHSKNVIGILKRISYYFRTPF